MRGEDTERIVAELVSRVCARTTRTGPARIREILEEADYHERKRLEADKRRGPAHARDAEFWSKVRSRLRHASERDLRQTLREVVEHYAAEIRGNFDPRVYGLTTRVLPTGLGLLLNAVSPLKLVQRFPQLPKMEDRIIIQGEVEHLRRLHERGTVLFVPTHLSNLDSPMVGFALYRMGLPPFVYGAGLNLFANPLLSFFMHNLGAYTVDRKKQDPLYKRVLKEYATLSLEHGYDNLFFPGGTRSRSGALESKLKRGLLGTGLAAYIQNLQRGAPRPRIFVVPCTLSSQLVLEAETLIDDFLQEVGKSRYIIDDDEFSQPRRVFDFIAQLSSLDSKTHVTVCPGLDPFGNRVDEDGVSLDPRGRAIDERRYVFSGGEPRSMPDRDAEYTSELAESIADAFACHNVIESTHVTARALFQLLRERNPSLSTLRLIRTGGDEDDLPLSMLYDEAERLLTVLRGLADRGRVRLGPSARGPADEVVADGLMHFSIYHRRAAARRRGDRVVPSDRTLLLYYQNRLEGYGLPGGDVLTDDRRALRSPRSLDGSAATARGDA